MWYYLVKMTKVVNVNSEPYGVYIGRPSIWGNPYSHKEGTLAIYKTKTRKESIEKYKEYLLNNEELLKRLPELKGKVLGCHCKPLPCHGDILVDLLEPSVKVDLEQL
jgi:hypothetical protein